MEFKYMDKIKVVSGFYEGFIGLVDSECRKRISPVHGNYIADTYNVFIMDNDCLSGNEVEICASDLELLKEKL